MRTFNVFTAFVANDQPFAPHRFMGQVDAPNPGHACVIVAREFGVRSTDVTAQFADDSRAPGQPYATEADIDAMRRRKVGQTQNQID